jgi:acyl-CoA reductase-like NAD-dependent aldehyde dehydrogenase
MGMIDHAHLIEALPAPRMLIGGAWVSDASAGLADLIDPSTGTPVLQVPMGGAAEAALAVAAAAAASAPAWRRLMPRKRRDLLLRLADLILSHRARLASIAVVEQGVVEQGLPGGQTYVRHCAQWFKYYAGRSEKIHGRVNPSYPVDALSYGSRRRRGRAARIPSDQDGLHSTRPQLRGGAS